MTPIFALALLLLSEQDDHLSLLNLRINSRILVGVQKPSIIVNPSINISGLKITLTRDDGKKIFLKVGSIKAGETRELKFDQEEGRHSYVMEATFKGSGEEPLKINFDVIVKKPPEIEVSKQTVDLEKKTIEFSFSEPCAHAELVVYGEGGRIIEKVKAEYGGKPERGKYRITWSGGDEAIIFLRLTAFDADGFYNGVEITPFFVEIPHKEVEFDFGSAEIRQNEEWKLFETLKEIEAALKKYGSELEIKLYIAGYTDTVDTKEYNRTLSKNRATAIGHFFRKHGLKIPIFVQGFGEDVLAVQTPDETQEPKNRRVIYILGNQPPPKSGAIPASNWTRLD